MAQFKIAGVQMDIEFANRDANLEKLAARLAETTGQGAQLTVFPECTTTGYCFDSLEEAQSVCEPNDGDSVTRVAELCKKHNTMVVFGFLESAGEKIFNSLALVGPSGCLLYTSDAADE